MKRLFIGLLCVVLLLPTAFATQKQPTEVEAAQALHSLRLFQGTTENRFDEESMALDRPATRVEAFVIFVRMLGKEEAVHINPIGNSFTDVDPWASPYVGYGFANGLTTGVGQDKFGSAQTVTLSQYVTFLLRAFGYSESKGDFSWETASSKGVELGLCDFQFVERCRNQVTRGDLVLLSYTALSLPLKDKTQTLAGFLVEQGAISAEEVTALGIPLEAIAGEKTVAQELSVVLNMTNALRAEATAKDGIARKPLVLDEQLTALAQIRAEETVESFSHTRPDGRSFGTVFMDHNYALSGSCYENIAHGYPTAQLVVEGWRDSQGHYENMIKPNTVRLGVGKSGDYWVQLFTN